MTCTNNSDSTDSAAVNLCVLGYAYQVLTSSDYTTYTEACRNVVKAMYLYCLTANSYKGQ